MKQRYYFVVPDLSSARELANDLLLARVEDKRMHFLAKRGTPLGELHEASFLQKSDIVHGTALGLVIGGILGALLGTALGFSGVGSDIPSSVLVPIITIIGALFGMWVSSMVAASVPNSHLRRFQSAMDQGQILLMLDIPMQRVEEVRELIRAKHPEAAERGMEHMTPVFP